MKNVIHTIISSLTFALLAMVAGYFIPKTYYQYFDQTAYYQVKNPVPVEKRDYKACDEVDVYIIRKSLIDGQGDSIINLSLVRDGNGTRERVAAEIKSISITKGDGKIITHWKLPCGIDPGEYFFEGTVKYQVRGIDKYTAFNTEFFKVVETPKEIIE